MYIFLLNLLHNIFHVYSKLHNFHKSYYKTLTKEQKKSLNPIAILFFGSLSASISAKDAMVRKNNSIVPAEHMINMYKPFPVSINLSVFSIIILIYKIILEILIND